MSDVKYWNMQGVNTDGDLYAMHVEVSDPDRFAFFCDDDGMTRQEFKDECDINVLMAQYEKHGTLPPLPGREAQYLDVSDVPDLHQAMSVIHAAETAFMTLPASIRKEFDNDPVKFVEYAQDEKNVDKMREWGLAKPLEVPSAPMKVEVVNQPAEPAKAPAAS